MKNTPLLVADKHHINEQICIRLPTVREILEYGEHSYYGAVLSLCSMPFDCMAQLDALGIDFEKITEFDLFLMNFRGMTQEQLDMVFVGLDAKDFDLAVNTQTQELVLYDQNHNICIDKNVQDEISSFLRRIFGLKKNTKKAGNSAAKKFLLERAHKKLVKYKEKGNEPYLENLVIKLICAPEKPGSLSEIMDMNIYTFNACLRQVQKRVEYDQVMRGVYAGTVDMTKINMEKIHWLSD